MSENYRRKQQHEAYFNEYELAALTPVLSVLGRDLGSFSKRTLQDFLSLCYSLPHADRCDPTKVLALLHIARGSLSSILRREIAAHFSDPEFCEALRRLIDGYPHANGREAQRGIRELLDQISRLTERGTSA